MTEQERQAGIQVSGDSRLSQLTTEQLRDQGFAVFNNGGIDAQHAAPDVFVFAVSSLDDSAVAEISRIRKQIPSPLVVVSSRGSSRQTARALLSGADECITRPYSAEELGARLRAVLRRTAFDAANHSHMVRTGRIVVDFDRRLITRDGEPVHLSRTEWRLLVELARNAGRIVPAAELLGRVWGPEYETETQYLRVRVWKLRRLLEEDPSKPVLLTTIPRIGYRLELID